MIIINICSTLRIYIKKFQYACVTSENSEREARSRSFLYTFTNIEQINCVKNNHNKVLLIRTINHFVIPENTKQSSTFIAKECKQMKQP